jgi:hypothetical protein
MLVVIIIFNWLLELLWESIGGDSHDDQMLLNLALKECHIQWQGNIANASVDGRCQGTGLVVTVLPQSDICRYRCNEKKGFHVWHQLARKISNFKRVTAEEDHVWYLREDWRYLNSARRSKGTLLKGEDWLTFISVS